MIIDKFYTQLFNVFEELVYIYDYENDMVLYLNEKAKQSFEIDKPLPLRKQVFNKDIKEIFFDSLSSTFKDDSIEIHFNDIKYNLIKNLGVYEEKNVLLVICTSFTNKANSKKMNNVLIQSIITLQNEKDNTRAISKILDNICNYFDADYTYIKESVTANILKVHYYAFDRENKKFTANIIYDDNEIYKWGEIIDKNDTLFSENLSDIKTLWSEKYEVLKAKEVKNISVILVKFLEQTIGFICIENIRKNKNDIILINSLIYFILNELKRKKICKKITTINLYDTMTGLSNKSKYIEYIDSLVDTKIKKIGVAFLDINNMHHINNVQGIEHGNRAIMELANTLKNHFRRSDLYCIKGDLFAIISQDISEDTFIKKINDINGYFISLAEYSISIGFLWEEHTLNIKNLLDEAKKYTQYAKDNYHQISEKYETKIYSSMATKSKDNKSEVEYIIQHDTTLDFKINYENIRPKQDIFNFKVKDMIQTNRKMNYIMIMLDINNFKAINETYSMEEGNKILFTISKCINEVLGYTGLGCYIHSDIFYFCCETTTDDYTLLIIKNFEESINKKNVGINISMSYGIYRIESTDWDVSEICKRASYAHKLSKALGGTNINFYDESLKQIIKEQKQLEDDMEYALKNNHFKLYLQPKYNVQTEEIKGAEALVRWKHHKRGLIFPNEFIPLFEKNGFILKLDMYMLEQTCKFLMKNNELGRKNFPIAVNLSKNHFKMENFFEITLEIVDKYNIDHSFIEFEITESLIVEDYDNIIKIVNRLKSEGFSIAIDDFGTGYSSLSLLKVLPIDTLKIDCGFFKDFNKCKNSSIIIKAIVDLSKNLNLNVVAEGVENEDEVLYLKKIDCDCIQGFYFSKPLPIIEFEKVAFS